MSDREPTADQEAALEQLLDAAAGVPRRFRTWEEICPVLPRRPTIRPATTPRPPMIPDDASPDQRFRILARTWWQVIEAYFGVRDFTFKRAFVQDNGSAGVPRRSKHWKLLSAAADKMVELEIAPVEWVRFRCDAWVEMLSKDYGGAVRPPPLNFVFAAKSFAKHLSWFEEFVADYAGGTVVLGPKQRELHMRWSQCRFDCQRNLQLSVEEIVEKHFPDYCYQDLLREARQEALEIQERLNAMVARGEYVWKQYAPVGA